MSASAERGVTAREIEDRLVHDDQLVLLERGLDVAHDAGVDAAAHQHRLVARVAFRRVHLAVRAGEELLGGRAVVGEHRPADAAVDLHGRAVDAKRPSQRISQPSDERSCAIVAPGAHREDDELVAAHAGHGVRLADDRLEAPGQRLQHEITGAMPAYVVHVLEAVEVDRDEGERLARTPRAAERLLDAIVEQHTVRKAGEWVAERFRVSVFEAPIEDDPCCGGDEREHDESRRNVVGCLAEDGREQARAEHERGQAQRPHERASQLPPPSSDRHSSPFCPVVGAAAVAFRQYCRIGAQPPPE